MRYGRMIAFILVVWLILCIPWRLSAQGPPGPLSLERRASVTQLEVGQQTDVEVVVSVEDTSACVRTQSQPADIVLVIDVSGSMETGGRIEAAQAAAAQFVERMDLSIDRVAIVTFHSRAFTEMPLTQDKAAVLDALEDLQTRGTTDTAAALREAGDVLVQHRDIASANIVLLSDGKSDTPSVSRDVAQNFRAGGWTIFTIGLGENADQDLLQSLSSKSGGYWYAPSGEELAEIYASIQNVIAQGGVEAIEVTVAYDDERLNLLASNPPATVEGATLIWKLPGLSDGDERVLRFTVQTSQAGSFQASPEAQLRYSCGGDPQIQDMGPAVDLIVLPPPTPTPLPPCEVDPLSNDCISTLVCLGPLSWPCDGLGLPWWVCLLLLLLLLSAILLWWSWHNLESQRRGTTVPEYGPVSSPRPDVSAWPSLPSPHVPDLLRPVERPTEVAAPLKTLVVGLGNIGLGVIQCLERTLQEAYGTSPSTVRYLALDIESGTETDDAYHIPAKFKIPGFSGDAQALIYRDWLPDEETLNSPSSAVDRPLHRLAFFADLPSVKARLGAELRALLREEGSDVTIYVVAALADAKGNTLMVDVAHWLRRLAKTENLSGVSVQAICLLPEAQTMGANFEAQGGLFRSSVAAWRELNRFQLVFETPYPMAYPGQRTVREGKLFERVYLLGPERDGGPPLTSNLQAGLYPAIADIIVGLADPLTRPAWEETARATNSRLSAQQRRRLETLYSSLGSFTYVLPIEDLLERQAIRFARDWIHALRVSDRDARADAFTFLAQPISPSGISSTALIQSVADLNRKEQPEAIAQANDLELGVLEWIGPFIENTSQKESREEIRTLASSGIYHHVLTSDVVQASDYSEDTQRLFRQAEKVSAQLSAIQPWLDGCAEVQRVVFKRMLDEKLQILLHFDPEHPTTTGPAAALAFLTQLEKLLADYRTVVIAAQQNVAANLQVARDDAQEQRSTLRDMAKRLSERHPRFGRAMLLGVIPAIVVTVLLGALALALPGWSLPLGGLAIIVAGIGAWFSYRQLFSESVLVRYQRAYLDAAQVQLAAEVELALYTAWERIAEDWHALVEDVRQPLLVWDQALQTMIDERLVARRAEVDALRTERNAIQVRRYLDDDALEDALYTRFFDPAVLSEARERITWQFQEDGTWLPKVIGTDTHLLTAVTTDTIEQSLLQVARAYASRVRILEIADVMTEWYAASAVAEESGDGSLPLIRTYPDLQPESEAHRLMSVRMKKQQAYFDEILHRLREPAAQNHTEQLATSSHPHRCSVLASLDVLRLAGLPTWEHAREVYSYMSHRARAALHIFPAETNAALWETRLMDIGRPAMIMEPTTCLALDDSRRALAFWRAFACGWIQEREASRQGITPLWALALTLPGEDVLDLTKPSETPPSLWKVAVAFVLASDREDTVLAIEAAWEDFVHPASTQERRAAIRLLESALKRADDLSEDSDSRTARLHILLRLVAEDGLRRVDGAQLLLG